MTPGKPIAGFSAVEPAHIGTLTFRLTVILILAALSWAVIALLVHMGATALL